MAFLHITGPEGDSFIECNTLNEIITYEPNSSETAIMQNMADIIYTMSGWRLEFKDYTFENIQAACLVTEGEFAGQFTIYNLPYGQGLKVIKPELLNPVEEAT